MRRGLFLIVAVVSLVLPRVVPAQGLTGALIGTVRDTQGLVLPGAVVRVSSPALIGGPQTVTTDEKGQLRFLALPPGAYVLDIELAGFRTYHEADIPIGAGATIERTARLELTGVAESIVVEGAGSRIEARDPGFGTRFRPEEIKALPTRRSSMFDLIRATPGVSPTSPASGSVTTVSAFGSGTNENQFLIDGTNMTCPCNGIARAEPGVDFIEELQIQSVGASVEFGNVQGAVINVITRQGGERLLYDASYYLQSAQLTSQPVLVRGTGYERVRYRNLTSNAGGPLRRDRLWFFAGYEYLRDYDSQPGADPALPRTDDQDKVFAKLTWKLSPSLQLMQSLHNEYWVKPDRPTLVTPFAATTRGHATVPAMTFGHLTHTLSANTLWDVRVGRFVYSQENPPSTGDRRTPSRFDQGTGVTSGAPAVFSELTLIRTTGKATLTHYRPGVSGGDQHWKMGVQVERGEHHSPWVIPTGVRYVDNNGAPLQAVWGEPSNSGGRFLTAAAFVSDAVTLGNRLTISAGLRFDYSRAISQDLHAVDLDGRETEARIEGLGTLYTWNLWSPRLGVTTKLSADGRAMLRASYGRFHQGVLTGEFGSFHPGVAPTRTGDFDPDTGTYTRNIAVVDPRVNLQLDAGMRAPRTDEFSIGVDREIGRRLGVAIAYVRKDGANFIGWSDVGGRYEEQTRSREGRTVPAFVLVNGTAARRFLLTNPDGYSLTYNGLVMVAEKRRANGWHAYGSYTLSRADGLQPGSGAPAAGAQVSTVAPPPFPGGVTFGRDPNDLTNARGRLANDRPHIFRVMGSVDVPRTGLRVAANLQHLSGKPWAASAQFLLPQGNQRILLEPRGTQRLSSQTLVDLRVSKTIAFAVGRVELLVDVLNLLNDTAGEAIATDNFFASTFGQPTVFMDPRRAMIGVRLNLGK